MPPSYLSWMLQSKTLGCDCLHAAFIEVNFSKFAHNNQIFRNNIFLGHYHLCKISSQSITCTIFDPYDFLQWTL